MSWLLLVGVFLASWSLTFVLRSYALRNKLMDVPNARSSHSIPTPRGGGVAIVVSFLAALSVCVLTGVLPQGQFIGLFGAGIAVALIGFADDHGHIAARWRLLGHFAAAIWILICFGGLAPLDMFGFKIDLGWFGAVLASIYLVWVLNLYNFMDGIDGIAGAVAICVTVAGAILYWLCGFTQEVWAPLLLASACAGFLVWNFPPAKIFMGDAGSGFLGIVLAGMALQAGWVEPQLFWSWLILMGVFIVDATYTMLHRLIRGEKIYEAHRSHAYQYASRQHLSHKKVTVAVILINVLWLTPLAFWVGKGGMDGVSGLLLAYLPLIVLAIRYSAGKAEA
ncbi:MULTISPECIES: MraY family glycosyltransferase [Pseudomonas]|jgi:Fuc2NAc and GlcNAc transferase|uniref:Glycosyl transferase n=1 Tax=Pseudomonas fluorescens TaxID=294 RepID=A0AAE2A5D8_PSEFL|nr:MULTISPECIES: glycosyltransferase family 4 protein [Pseudomonas]KIF58353.1 glycosyl transferase [Pseudomonas fluorescens]MBP3997351.1 glycosyltransferase family 4 protein [Pseudomonas koreensis]QIA04651.1 glycosyltransferase family 4 protein [Pseudomonas fluorescens]TFA86721.1 Fuc2NAc and GlcNAc transferase [Pseudomonas sp. LAIL14HWK12:I2]SCZ18795.1 Fuc2NAc and GlcNAc transferase [Pseudomonas sp. NFIX46]